MENDYIKKALVESVRQWLALRARVDDLKAQEAELEREAFLLLPKIHSLFELCGDLSPTSAIGKFMKTIKGSGLTTSVINILKGTGEWMSPIQIRDQMIRFRIDLTKSKNPVSSIHTILGRLVESGKVEQDKEAKTGKAIFRWKQPSRLILERNEPISDEIVETLLVSPKKKQKPKTEKPMETKEVKGLLN